jgi:hypothetical protein
MISGSPENPHATESAEPVIIRIGLTNINLVRIVHLFRIVISRRFAVISLRATVVSQLV